MEKEKSVGLGRRGVVRTSDCVGVDRWECWWCGGGGGSQAGAMRRRKRFCRSLGRPERRFPRPVRYHATYQTYRQYQGDNLKVS